MLIEQPIVYLVDDDPAIRQALPIGLKQRGLRVKAFSSARLFLDAFSPEQPSCLILDLNMPDMGGLELQQELLNRDITTPIIFITGHGSVPQSVQAIRAGAIDFLEKPFLPELLAKRVEEALVKDKQIRSENQKLSAIRARFKRLTEREKEVCQLLLDNDASLSSKAIAKTLHISHRTVEQHRARILEKTHAKSTSDLLSLASVSGLLPENLN